MSENVNSNKAEDRAKVRSVLRTEQPYLVVGCPPCTESRPRSATWPPPSPEALTPADQRYEIQQLATRMIPTGHSSSSVSKLCWPPDRPLSREAAPLCTVELALLPNTCRKNYKGEIALKLQIALKLLTFRGFLR